MLAGLVCMTAVRAFCLPCQDVQLRSSEDGAYFVGSFEGSSSTDGKSRFRWLVNGQVFQDGPVEEVLYLPCDGTMQGAGGEIPLENVGSGFGAGRWGQALVMAPGGRLRYAREGQLTLREGTIELWLALLQDGTSSVYTASWHPLFHYQASEADTFSIMQASGSGVLYAGGNSAGRWQSAFGSGASMLSWKAGEWHHFALTYSSSGNFLRVYLDGRLVADSNEGGYVPPSSAGNDFWIGSLWGQAAAYVLDEVRFSSRALSPVEVAARARRTTEPAPNEVWLEAAQLSMGNSLVFEALPSGTDSFSPSCFSDPLSVAGIPLIHPFPASALLAAGTTNLLLSLESIVPTTCRYSVNEPLDYAQMSFFESGSGGTQHFATIQGLNPDPLVVNRVFVRCEASPDAFLELRYRCLTTNQPSYPRTFNLWGEGSFYDKSLEDISRIDLWIGAWFDEPESRILRQMNPAIRLLTWMDAIAVNYEAPDEYYLRDTQGQRVELWVGCYLLNITRPEVVDYMVQRAYERTVAHNLSYDGCFFDNVMLTQSWRTEDIYGRPVAYDADEDGVPDDPAAFDAAWGAGVRRLLSEFRRRLPGALMMCHSFHAWEPGFVELYNGTSLGFYGPEVRAGERDFGELWDTLQIWKDRSHAPALNAFEAAVHPELGYGYGYEPWTVIPPATLEFVRTDYAAMRFGLALSLMGDEYYTYEFSDTWHGNDWWYDELDFDLGRPLGPCRRVPCVAECPPDLQQNGGFEAGLVSSWWFSAGSGSSISLSADHRVEGLVSARVDVPAAPAVYWEIVLALLGVPLTGGVEYEVSFCVRSEAPGALHLAVIDGVSGWKNLGLTRRVAVGTQWRTNTVTFRATDSTAGAHVQFLLGENAGVYWLDDVQVRPLRPEILRRDFAHGVVLLNRSSQPQTLELEPGLQRLAGEQAPRHDWIVDDAGASFSASAPLVEVSLDSGKMKATGPYYHDWGPSCHLGSGTQARATWRLEVPEAGSYVLSAWWPAAPGAGAWSTNVVFEIWDGPELLASRTVNQRQDGDQWNLLATVDLHPSEALAVRMLCPQGGAFVADALHVSSLARYNDGADVQTVVLGPLDGLVLRRADSVFPGEWTRRYFPESTDIQPLEDSDGDGMSNWDEYLAGSDPTDGQSVFRLPSARWSGDALAWSLPTLLDRVYTLQETPGLHPSAWSNLFSFQGTGGDVLITNVQWNAWQGFYRLIVAPD